MTILQDTLVLDFTQFYQGPVATQKLADIGAEVIKVERPDTGDPQRNRLEMGQRHGGENPAAHSMNRNKRSVTLDLTDPRAREVCLDIGAEADVVVNNFKPGKMREFGLAYDDFTEVNEEIIYCQATGYGSSGPHADKPGQDLLVQARTGMTLLSGREDDPPIPLGIPVTDLHGATLLAFGILGALLHRERTGEGQRLEVNLFDAAVDLQQGLLSAFANLYVGQERSETGIARIYSPAPYGVYETVDGYIAVSLTDLDDLADLVDAPQVAEFDDEFADRDAIKRELEPIFAEKSTDEWLDVLEPAGVWCAPVQSYDDLVDDPQLHHNDMLETVDHPRAGEITVTGFPVAFGETPGEIAQRPPLLGEHTENILKRFGYEQDEIREFQDDDVI